MASIDKMTIKSTTYDMSPSPDGDLDSTQYSSNDEASPTSWTNVDTITLNDNNKSIFSKLTAMIKNIRWLKNNNEFKVNRTGDAMSGKLVAKNSNESDYTSRQVRNIFLSTNTPTASDGENGDVWIQYEE